MGKERREREKELGRERERERIWSFFFFSSEKTKKVMSFLPPNAWGFALQNTYPQRKRERERDRESPIRNRI